MPELYIVSLPIGNIGDITRRAVDILSAADCIACEDTRDAALLFSRLGISNKLFSYHEHNKEEASEYIISCLNNGKSVAIVSDAGTPCISDPGYMAVKKARDAGFDVVPVPGASALLSALSVSGFPTNSFMFLGFLPAGRKNERERILSEALPLGVTLILYEAPHRIQKLLYELEAIKPDIEVFIGREMTKKHEEFMTGTPRELLEHFNRVKPRGELTVILNQHRAERNIDADEIAAEFERLKKTGSNDMDTMKAIAKKTGISKSEIYRLLKKPR